MLICCMRLGQIYIQAPIRVTGSNKYSVADNFSFEGGDHGFHGVKHRLANDALFKIISK